ncbi:MAG: CPBP family intramembrane metalloprotease [Chloroflexota bacterium]|nr:MAG: CPBP family intramembrane metalloprotease [Chloroflexota bacterium]
MSEQPASSIPPFTRVLLALLLPIAGAALFSLLAGGSAALSDESQSGRALQFAGAGLVSWFVGWRWYSLKGLGLRGGRPLMAGIGFATLAWLAFIVVRFVAVEVANYGSPEGARTFIYLLLFEAFCTQLWAYGLFFRSVADWHGPLTAAVSAGILFGALAFLFFQESFAAIPSGLLYFTVWGVLYGVIRLRTGSFLGPLVVQALQSWTTWYVMAPLDPVNTGELRNLYLISSAIYLIIIWRLWPRQESDYRV